MSYLPYDVARCPGYQADGEWRDGCETCLRRTAPAGPRSPFIEPPPIIVFECDFLIEPRLP